MVTAAIAAEHRGGRLDLHRLQIRRAADQLAAVAARPFEQHGQGAPETAAIESRLLAVDLLLQALQALGFYLFLDLLIHVGAGRARPRRVFE